MSADPPRGPHADPDRRPGPVVRKDAGVVADHDAAVRRLDSEAPSGCDHRPLIGHDAPLAALDQAIRGDRPGRAADPQDAPDAVA